MPAHPLRSLSAFGLALLLPLLPLVAPLLAPNPAQPHPPHAWVKRHV